ncbi:MAG: AzlD domain-containing protein [Anaerolineales bacterium]|nr:AzlD domain-containing protein [Anaerolineales bacterium]
MKIWIIMLALGIGTFLIRYSIIGLAGRIHIPPRVERAFRFIPASMLSALVISQLSSYASSATSPLTNSYYLAAFVACGVAWKTRNTLLTVFVGMVVLWVLRALSG